ncbi:MAG: YciI family protein [Zavarzinella sp.]
MNKYLFVYRSKAADEAAISPEQMQEILKIWTDWINTGFQQGWMVDPGDALHPDGHVVHPDKTVTDGPFMEAHEIVGGYSVIQCESYEAAVKIAKDCPGLLHGTVEIRHLAGVGGPPSES